MELLFRLKGLRPDGLDVCLRVAIQLQSDRVAAAVVGETLVTKLSELCILLAIQFVVVFPGSRACFDV